MALYQDNKSGLINDPQKAKSVLKPLMDLQKEMYGENSPEVANSLRFLAAAYAQEGNAPAARKALEEANNILVQPANKDRSYVDVIANTNDIGSLYAKEGNYTEAEKSFLKALEIAKQHSPGTNRATIDAMLSTYREYIAMVRSLKDNAALGNLQNQDPELIKREALQFKNKYETFQRLLEEVQRKHPPKLT